MKIKKKRTFGRRANKNGSWRQENKVQTTLDLCKSDIRISEIAFTKIFQREQRKSTELYGTN